MSQSQFIGNLYNQIAKVLEFENNEENKLKLKLMENLVETELTNDANLAQVLKKLCEIKKIGPRDFNLLVKASDSLGHSNLSKWLRDEEISNMALYLSLTEKHDPKDANNNETDQKKNYIIVEINGVKLELKFQPYKFQVSLAKLGCDGLNNIVCVRTGSGKTLVAALVCKYWIAKLGRNNFHAVFIVPTRHLATQQMEAFVMAGFDLFRLLKNYLKSTKLENLEEIKETTKEPRTATYIRERQVVFLTAMKFYNALAQGQIRISELSMLIFDECHHTTEKHPYNDIMRFYIQEKQQQMAKMPIILGLTASLGVGRVKHAEKHLIKLCSNLRCTRISSLTRDEDIQDLKKNIPSVLDDEIIQVDIGPNGLIEFINSITEYSEKIQKVIRYSSGYFLGTPDYERTLHEMKKTYEEKNKRKELIGVRCLIDLNLIYLRAHDLPLDSCVEYAQECYDKMKYAAVSEHDDRDVKLMTSFCLKSLESLIESGKRFGDNPLYENTKLKKLVEIILKCHKGNSRGLILLRTRHGVTVMEKYLNKHPDLLNRQIQSVKLLGQNNSEDSISMNESEQKKAIEKFRKGECNILVATDIAQEGLDVPECNYVIRYEFVSNEIGTVQSRGRARANAGQLYLITQRDGLNYRRELENHERERDMQKAIVEFNKLDQNFITQEIESLYKEPPNLFQSASVQSFRDIMGDSTFPMSPSIDSLSSFTFSAPSRVPTRTGNDSNPSHFHVHCRECGVGLFPATDLRFREPSYYSINTEFIRRAIRVQDTDLPSKVFYCARASCGIELGREVAMRRGSPLYMIDIKGVKFANKNKPGNFIVHAKWSKIEFNVKPI